MSQSWHLVGLQAAPAPHGHPHFAHYVPITACRIVDTCGTSGPFANREIRDFQAFDDAAIADQGQGPGGISNCSVAHQQQVLPGLAVRPVQGYFLPIVNPE